MASLKHLSLTVLVALTVSLLVFDLWYPFPYREISGGQELFRLVIGIDVIAGPMLTMIVYKQSKPRRVWFRDLGVILLLQLSALAYGIWVLAEARPVRLVFEGNRFRVVTLAELDSAAIQDAPPSLRPIGMRGPMLIGARLSQPTDPDFVQSVRASMEGFPPALRPSRWVSYDAVLSSVKSSAKPLANLLRKYPDQTLSIAEALAALRVQPQEAGYVPLVSRTKDDWATLIDMRSGLPLMHVHLDAW